MEIEEENKLVFLDVLIIVHENLNESVPQYKFTSPRSRRLALSDYLLEELDNTIEMSR